VARDWVVIVPAVITLAVMVWGITAPAYWADEADTVSAASRSLPQMIPLLGHVDAVHGLYYLLIWPLVRLAGPGELVTRLPSAVAMAVAAGGIAATGRRLMPGRAGPRAGLCAGLAFAALPVISGQAHNARPYALVTAVTVLAGYLLVRAVDDPLRRWFALYGGALAVLGYLELFALLLVPAHALTLCLLGRRDRGARLARWWAAAVACAALAVAPLAVAGWLQRGQISWIHRPGWGDASTMLASLAGGPVTVAVAAWAVAAFGCARALAPARGRTAPAGRRLALLALPWLLLPPAVMLAVSQVKPVYNFRYVVFCIPALALLAGLGLASLRPARRASAAVLILALAMPAQLGMRVPGKGMREAASFVSAREQPGDAIVYPGDGIPPWYLAYPGGFGRLRDIGLARSPAASGRLYGVSVPVPVLKQREQQVRRIWVVQMGHWQSPAGYLGVGFRLIQSWRFQGGYLRIWLYGR
jgi:mannosyltransferase